MVRITFHFQLFYRVFVLAALITADTSMLVYMLGAVKARPFIMALHAFIGVGFLIATLLVKPFLPEARGTVCHGDASPQGHNSSSKLRFYTCYSYEMKFSFG